LANGYRIKYIVNAGYDSAAVNIIDVSTLPNERVLQEKVVHEGYIYVVLARNPTEGTATR
jgi:hypothetical protein